MRQLTVEDMKARIARLAELERGLAREIALQRDNLPRFWGREALTGGRAVSSPP